MVFDDSEGCGYGRGFGMARALSANIFRAEENDYWLM